VKSIDYIRSLPAVFSISEAALVLKKSLAWTRLSIHRWAGYGLIYPAGPRAGLFFNLVVDPDWKSHLSEAIRRIFPSAVVIGASVLHAEGWTTQIPQKIHIAILSRPSFPRLNDAIVVLRPRTWYSEHVPFQETLYGLPSLKPSQALDDLKKNASRDKLWCPAPDDLYLPDDFKEA